MSGCLGSVGFVGWVGWTANTAVCKNASSSLINIHLIHLHLHPHCPRPGITLSQKQVERGTQLAKDRGLTNVTFRVMDALAMEFKDDSFDLVWACESGEHMPDKKKYVEEMTRVLAPGE